MDIIEGFLFIMEHEIWNDIPEYNCVYQASSMGRVRSIDRLIFNSNGISKLTKGKILTPKKDSTGYMKIGIFKDKKRIFYAVSRLVYASFIGGIDLKYLKNRKIVIDHIDGDKSNNNINNLRKVTSRENSNICYKKNSDTMFSLLAGVDKSKSNKNKFRSRIYIDGKTHYLGLFNTEIEAHEAYKSKLIELNSI